jgi:tetratricopeptide (TPR) repeat protein
VFGGFAAMVVLWVAVQATLKRNVGAPVEGSSSVQQQSADSLMEVLARDSTNVDAHQHLADLYYDTANWEPAVIHYRAVLRRDSMRTTALVDLGVCYFNLGDKPAAEAAFANALNQVPEHPVALFNLGIVYESRDNYPKALEYFHRALESSPPGEMHTPLVQAIQRVQQKSGVKAPPLASDGAGAGSRGR